MDKIDISIVIPTLGRQDDLNKCLDSLSKQKLLNFEVIIVSDKISAIESVINKYNNFSIITVEIESKGLTSSRNSGLAGATGRIVSFIDDDVVFYPAWSKELTASFDGAPDIGGVSGPTIIADELSANRDVLAFHNKIKKNIFWKLIGKVYTSVILEGEPYAVGRIFKSGAFSIGSNYPQAINFDKDIEVDYLEACNMSFRKDILDRIGGFSTEYKGVGDWSEPDLAFRVRQAGFRLLFNPKVRVEHNISQKGVFQDRGKDSYQRMKNFLHFYFKWIKPNTPGKLFRFAANLVFLDMYWFYKFIQTRRSEWLGGIVANLK